MSPQTKSIAKAVKEGFYVAMGIAAFWFLFDVWETKTYKQPEIDKIQNQQITFCKSQLSEMDSMQSYKMSNVNQRIDKLNDLMKPLSIQLNILLGLNEKALKQYQEVEKLLKYQTEK